MPQGDHFSDHIKFPDFSIMVRQRILIYYLTLWSTVVSRKLKTLQVANDSSIVFVTDLLKITIVSMMTQLSPVRTSRLSWPERRPEQTARTSWEHFLLPDVRTWRPGLVENPDVRAWSVTHRIPEVLAVYMSRRHWHHKWRWLDKNN